MRNVLPFGILMMVGMLLLRCGAGSESAETVTDATNEDAGACLGEMKVSLEGILAEEHAEWSAR